MAIAPPPVAANDCDSTIDCLIDTVPPTPPGPCGIIQIESCRCLTHIGACGIEVPDPCDMGDCGCVAPQHVNSDDLRVCGFSVNPCAWLEGAGASNLCACVNVPTTTTFGRAPSGSGSCGIALPGPGGQPPGPVPNPCDGLPEDTCECISISNTIPGVALSAVPDYVCGIPTNPCALVGTGTLADGCGCVEMNDPQRLSLAGLFAATSVTSTGIIPTSICGIPTDPCATSAGAMACECVAQIEREVLQGGGGGETPAILAFQRIVTPPALCVSLIYCDLPNGPPVQECIWKELPSCTLLTEVDGTFATNSHGEFIKLYAHRPAYTDWLDIQYERWDIYAAWRFSGHTITVGVDHYEISIAVQYPAPYGPAPTWHWLYRATDAPSEGCFYIGTIYGRAFDATAQAGVEGVAGNQSCAHTTSSNYSITAGVEYKFSPVPSASGTLSGTIGWGQQDTCTNGTIFDSELVLGTVPHKPELVPLYAT